MPLPCSVPAPHKSSSAPAMRALEALAIVATGALWLRCAARLAARITADPSWLVVLAVAGLCGLLVADLLSGAVHFACDRFGSPHTRVLGPLFIAPFREHHRDPEAIARHGFCERNGNNCIAVLPPLALAHACTPPAFAQAVLLAVAAALAWTNQVHAWAHAEQVPAWVRRLQRAGLLLRPTAHGLHHAQANDRAYCITTGWLNRGLDRIGAWSRIEQGLRRVFPSRGA